MSTQTNTVLEKLSNLLTKEIVKQITSLAKIEGIRFEIYLKIKDFVVSNLEVKDKVAVVVSSPIVLQEIIVEGIGYYRLFLFNALDNTITAYVGDFTERYVEEHGSLKGVPEEHGSLKEVPVVTPTQSKDPKDHTPVEEWIHVLLDSYRKLISLEYNEPKPSHFNYAKLTKEHLLWMCDELVKYTDTGKRHRWLGYIQGVLAMDGCLSVQREMDVTRELIAPSRISDGVE